MVGFCDIPLGQMKEHLDWYGNYAIGIKRAYARSLNINPVWYINRDNPVIRKLYKSKNHTQLTSSPILPFLKQIYGKQPDVKGNEHYKRFYNEREWRYVPVGENYTPIFLKGSPHKKLSIFEKRNPSSMKLDISKIEYLIVNNNDEKRDLYQIIKGITKNTDVLYENLISSILTIRQIRNDF